MLKSHEKFHSANGRRLILIADDEAVNRELLEVILENDYEVIFAADGRETLEQIRTYRESLSLVLLDLMMPVMTGQEVLKHVKADPELKGIPVIVLTADQNAEIESLNLGAIDYIPKPYPQAGIIQARIHRVIELSEDRDIIQSTERDPLTGLYNREYFYRYAEQYDQHHRDQTMDAIVVDINHFHMLNERFGTAYGDEVLRSISEKLREAVADLGGIVCRREADIFMIYCPSGLDYRAVLEKASIGLAEDSSVNSRVRLRMGVYQDADKDLEVERRFDRAKMASEMVRNSFTKTIGYYDSSMHERELYQEQLIDDFHKAIEEKQFQVYFQPKFDIRPQNPVLTSAEALVRWQHPERGLISPGIFIPLFEDNGLIRELDRYVWRETARYLGEWKQRLGFTVPASVNVSRIDMYDPELVSQFEDILSESGISPEELYLEITESAYTQDSGQIIETVNRLRELGFRIEMDDFGTGYSSLNMISSLPIDALKLDMQFIRSAFKEQKDTRMLEVIIDIADRLGVPVIAEGVETEEQMVALKDLGCDIVQGYYFSKPVPADAFESFLLARRDLPAEELLPESEAAQEEQKEAPAGERKVRAKARPVQLRLTNYVFAIIVFALAAVLALTDLLITRGYRRMEDANRRYVLAGQAASDLEGGSDYLTESVRIFAVTGDLGALNDYFTEVNVTKRRDRALESLDQLLGEGGSAAYESLSKAMDYSVELMEREYRAMRLTQLAYGHPDESVPEVVRSVALEPEELGMEQWQKRNAAEALVFDGTYLSYKDQIRTQVGLCTQELIRQTADRVDSAQLSMDRLLKVQTILLVLLVLSVIAEVVFITLNVRIPLTRMVSLMRAQETIPPAGAAELVFVTQTYNEILEKSRRTQIELSYEANHDALTGLLNRSAYEEIMERTDKDRIAVIIVDVDHFKSINDTYGHDVGDRILKKVAGILTANFRSVDAVCRLGGDEFVVIMTRANSSMRQLVINKIGKANDILQHPKDGLPIVTLSAGAAFGDRKEPEGNIFKDADTALYHTKTSGRCGCTVYGDKD